jgi:EAL domain-containing protein (putative c-di-GMP-specific phosphodiesterase class I)
MYATKRDTSDESVLLRRGVDAGDVRDVESALEKNELLVVYQPILDLRTGSPHSAEALIRRVLPDGGLILPAEFVPHVERTPLVRELTFLVVADALESAARWSKAGHDLGVSINIPYRLLDDPQFAEGLADMLRLLDPTSPQVTLEVVPAGPGAGAQVDEEVLARFDAIGVRLSLDDAGRAASFAALRVLPLDEIKIDVGFVHGLGKSAADEALVRGIIDIGHALGLDVVAEGVETREAWNSLSDWGCDYAQGYFVAHPRRSDELIEWLGTSWPAVA